jgi:asparagine synthase (glutamine-hydrolysing)
MSGICGVYEPGREFERAFLGPMLDVLATPGEAERKVCGGISALLGVSASWIFQQVGSFGGVLVAADADLIDRSALHAELGLSHESNSNVAEQIARLYLRDGMNFLKLLHGAFSAAIWDERSQRLILVIDRFGMKSLYWRRENSRILFASRLGAVRNVQCPPAEVNFPAVLQYLLYSAVPAPMTIDQGTQRLRPGTYVKFDAQKTEVHQYWDLKYETDNSRSVRSWAKELREQLRSAVYRHLDGWHAKDTGCYLSGGTDSSSVVAFTSERHVPTQTFSVVFEESGFSEIEFARTAANRFQTQHHEKWLSPQDAWEAMEKLIDYYDEPFANSSAIGSYHCARLARDSGVKVLLAGDGGDELFAGNERYAHDKYFSLYQVIPKWLRQTAIEPAVRLLPENDGFLSLARRYVRRANLSNPRRILSYGFFLSFSAREIFEPEFLVEAGQGDWLSVAEEHFHAAAASDELNRILYLDVKMTLADNDLRKVSGTAELAGINVRYPLLDDCLAEFSGLIPAGLKLRGFEKRYIFKQAMKGILPDKILYKKKHGFGVPLARWLLSEAKMRDFMNDILHDARTRQRGYFRTEFYDRLMDLHREQPNFYGEIVWYLMALELWHRKHFDRSRETVHAR